MLSDRTRGCEGRESARNAKDAKVRRARRCEGREGANPDRSIIMQMSDAVYLITNTLASIPPGQKITAGFKIIDFFFSKCKVPTT